MMNKYIILFAIFAIVSLSDKMSLNGSSVMPFLYVQKNSNLQFSIRVINDVNKVDVYITNATDWNTCMANLGYPEDIYDISVEIVSKRQLEACKPSKLYSFENINNLNKDIRFKNPEMYVIYIVNMNSNVDIEYNYSFYTPGYDPRVLFVQQLQKTINIS